LMTLRRPFQSWVSKSRIYFIYYTATIDRRFCLFSIFLIFNKFDLFYNNIGVVKPA
jgi:hypothetical protein